MNGSGGGTILGFAMLVAIVTGYFLPGVIAKIRGHESAGAIAVLNLILGWTVIGWFVCLVLAFTGTTAKAREAKEDELYLLRRIANGVHVEPAPVAAIVGKAVPTKTTKFINNVIIAVLSVVALGLISAALSSTI